jgi:tetratricopeptide (TPR) repeat protein
MPDPPSSRPLNEEAENRKIKGNEFLKDKKYDEAVREYNKAITADPENPTYYSNRAAAWVREYYGDGAAAWVRMVLLGIIVMGRWFG